jgi:hypothetical protein
MAIPTFSSISPAVGPSGGRNVVFITGSNFQLPAAVPTTGVPVPATVPTVAVEFDGVAAERVDVLGATSLRVIAPAYRRSRDDAAADPLPKVGVTVRNIDSNGDTIPGETVTAALAYQYERVKLRPPASSESQQIFRQVAREVIELFQRQIVPNVAGGTGVDFGDRGEIIIKPAVLPNVTLVGPRIIEDMVNRHHWADFFEQLVDGDPETYERFLPSSVDTYEYDYILASNSRREMLAMVQGVREMFKRTPFVRIPITFGDLNGPQFKFPFHLVSPPNVDLQDPNSNLVTGIGSFEVRWVPFRLDEAVDSEKRIEEAYLESEQTGSSTPRTPIQILD